MKRSDSKVILVIFLLSCIVCIGIPYVIWKANGNSTIANSELIQVSGNVGSIRKTVTPGRYSQPLIYITLSNKPYKFRIGGSAYKAINSNQVINEINVGDNIEIDTRPNELARSSGNSVINRILVWRGQPMIYGLRKDNKSYLTISQYNSSQESYNVKNLFWGSFLVIFLTGINIWNTNKEKNKK